MRKSQTDPPTHYFTPTPMSESKPRVITVTHGSSSLEFTIDGGVFSRNGIDAGTAILLDALVPYEPMTGRALDLGCGWGVIGAFIATRNPSLDVTMSDINTRAVDLAEDCIRRNHLPMERVRAVVSDGFTNIVDPGGPMDGSFDWIITNPPIRCGKPAVHALLTEAHKRLNKGGRLALVWRKQQGAESAMDWLSALFTSVERITRDKGYWVIMCVK